MTDGDIIADCAGGIVGGANCAVVLDIGDLSDYDGARACVKDGIEPNTAMLAYGYVAV